MFEEEAFLAGEKLAGGANERSQGGGHLESDEEEDANPDSDGAFFAGAGMSDHFEKEASSKTDGNDPGENDEKAEEFL